MASSFGRLESGIKTSYLPPDCDLNRTFSMLWILQQDNQYLGWIATKTRDVLLYEYKCCLLVQKTSIEILGGNISARQLF